MGQKINPIGLRLGINRGWDSTWFAKKKDFGRLLIEDFKIRKYIKKNIVNSGVSEIIIERSSKKCTVSIHTSRPGFVIGKKGADIEKIKKNVIKITNADVNINIKEIKKPELNSIFLRLKRPKKLPLMELNKLQKMKKLDLKYEPTYCK